MLKIKDNVDLKELEKYGFEYFINGCGTYGYCFLTKRGFITIVEKDEEFNNEYNEERMIKENDIVKHIDLLYDLIKADLVEKVGE